MVTEYIRQNGDISDYTNPTRADGRRKNGPKVGWQVATMWESHHEIARMILLGHSNVEVAASLGITKEQVSNVRNSPVVQENLTIMKAARDV